MAQQETSYDPLFLLFLDLFPTYSMEALVLICACPWVARVDCLDLAGRRGGLWISVYSIWRQEW